MNMLDTPRMDPDIKAEWIEKLRDPELVQAKGVLREMIFPSEGQETLPVEGRCCLGVLCDLASLKGQGSWSEKREGYERYSFITQSSSYWVYENQEATILPRPVAEWAGFSDGNPLVPGLYGRKDRESDDWNGPQFSLAELNDHGFTFSQIADVIEYFL